MTDEHPAGRLTALTPATRQDGTYPRPQLVRAGHRRLDGGWRFAIGERHEHDRASVAFDRDITVPFPPESPASGIGHVDPLPVVWYRRVITAEEVSSLRLPRGHRVILHFGAVDYRADVWLGDRYLGWHEGGQTPFRFDVTEELLAGDAELVVRAADEPDDARQPRGKQDWRDRPHSIWYERTTGIWQPVWLEAVPQVRVGSLSWWADLAESTVHLEVETEGWEPAADVRLDVVLRYGDDVLSAASVRITAPEQRVPLAVPALDSGPHAHELHWSPEHPRLVDAELVLTAPGSRDEIVSYLGLREVGVEDRDFLLNGHPYFLRSVLQQGYWPETHLAAGPEALRTEAELIKRLGFNATRIHQKVEDPRFLYWCDRLGIAVWGETANAFAFSTVAVERLTREWLDIVRRDRSHPCIVAWVPLNESWGVQHSRRRPRERQYARGLAALTRALDDTRPVISNDGWEHTDSDILTVHDYATDGTTISGRFGDRAAFAEAASRRRSSGRRLWLDGHLPDDRPVMLTEFGGIKLGDESADGWGYSTATSAADFQERLTDVVDAARTSSVLSGYCYTQLADTGQEVNGLLRADRSPKLPFDVYREIFGS